MRLKLTFQSSEKIFLPTGYFSLIQGLIYGMLDRLSANWLHSQGFKHKNRFFKLFVFSEINEKAKFIKNKGFLVVLHTFKAPMFLEPYFVISFPLKKYNIKKAVG